MQITDFGVSGLKLTHFVGLMTFVKQQYEASFDEEVPAPAKVAEQWSSFLPAYNRLDKAYKAESYSLYTQQLKDADDACDKIFMSAKKMTQAQQGFDFDQQKKQSADRMMQCIDKYKINTAEDYLGQNNKMQQLLEEIEGSATLTHDATVLGLTDALAQLKEKVTLVRQLLTERGASKAPKGEMQAARSAMEPEYKWMMAIINAAALMSEDPHQFDALIIALNQNIDYLKNVVLARQGGEGEDEGGDEPEPSPEPEPTPEPEPQPDPSDGGDNGGDGLDKD